MSRCPRGGLERAETAGAARRGYGPAVQPVFVGDVQGCGDELELLLERVAAACGERDFRIWQVGDLVNRGPHNLAVLERVRGLHQQGRARIVLGNHDVTLIRVHLGLRQAGPRDTFGDVLASADADDWIGWLRGLPMVETGHLGDTPFAMVHASVAPEWTFDELESRASRVEARLGAEDLDAVCAFLEGDDAERDDLERMLHGRSVSPDGSWSSDEPRRPRDAWHAAFAARGYGYGVVYGHWAMQGLHEAQYLRGLDTGCVHHGRGHNGFLTAWLPDVTANEPFGVPDSGTLVQVKAHAAHYKLLLEKIDSSTGSP